MINLIPNEEKKKIRKDFYMRVVIVSFFVLGIAILISNIMLTPALFYASLEKKLISEQFAKDENKLAFDLNQENKNAVESLESKITLIKQARDNKFLVSAKVVDNLLNKKINGILINEINYTKDPNKGNLINIRGKASSRERLLTFKNSLASDPNFKNVDLPISNFIKSTDIEFSLVLIAS
ncbi:MAG: hypothetical protein KBD14_00495 [Candidatus Pacebacteria bacterium]|nr:hypothetical protein [Candidatus Paceibacterota bacterium]